MVDKVSKEVRSRTMSAIRSNDTKMEVKFRKALFAEGIRFRKNVSGLTGKPDVAIKSKKIAVFLDSCFWHRCPRHFRRPQSNLDYWIPKIDRNTKRDKMINARYKKMGWKVFRFWEHEVEKSLEKCVGKVAAFIQS